MTRNSDADESELVGKTIEDVEDDTNTTTAADELAELTGRDRGEFEPDAEIPQFEDQEIEDEHSV